MPEAVAEEKFGGIMGVDDAVAENDPEAVEALKEQAKDICKRSFEAKGYRCTKEPQAELVENPFPRHHVEDDGFEWDDPRYAIRAWVYGVKVPA